MLNYTKLILLHHSEKILKKKRKKIGSLQISNRFSCISVVILREKKKKHLFLIKKFKDKIRKKKADLD